MSQRNSQERFKTCDTECYNCAQSNAAGKVFKEFDGDIDLDLTAPSRERFLSEGLTLNKKIRLRDDAERVHVVVSDPVTGTAGSVIIPAAKVRTAAAR